MSVSASGGTGQVATSVSCFGGLGQLYRVKVWAVSGPNISQKPAVKCLTPDGQSVDQATVNKHCIGLHIRWAVQKGGRAMTLWLCTVNAYTLVNMVSIFLKVKQQNIKVQISCYASEYVCTQIITNNQQ